jgi:hypothetical protein|tara:strand:+ start:2351 stop:2866 length:516 start_codon:yes stop_codon:yes gene_type:complete
MATTKTTQLADAISILSSVLSTEVAEGNHFLEDDDIEMVTAEDHEELKESATDFISTHLVDLESIQSDLQGLVDDITPSNTNETLWGNDEDEEDDEDESDADSGEEESTDVEPTDGEKLEAVVALGEELEDKIELMEGTIAALTESLESALAAVDSLVEDAEAHQVELEAY